MLRKNLGSGSGDLPVSEVFGLELLQYSSCRLGDDCSSFSAIGLGESCSISIRLVGALPLHLAGDVWVLA
ncbi:hypothetical protein V6N13_074235 [Hibiscus sabdariffa]